MMDSTAKKWCRRHASTCASHCLLCCLNLRTCVCLQSLSISVCSGADCWLLTVSSAYSAVSLCLHFCQPLSGIVWLLTGLDTSHPIFSWSKNDWHTNMFQLTASITTVQCLMNRCWLFPWILFNVQCMIANKCFYHSFISGSSRLSISPTKGHKVAINGIFAIDNWSLY